ncbi:MAG: hypothetical protein NW214_07300 [Pseudanabaenaceae cyanobacterium bins.39]|nr:hypothetical protein [Pseudanabaenaceae cyanobacterium bins.39]
MYRSDVELQLMILEPHGLLDKYCVSTRDIYVNRYILRELPYKGWIVEKIAGIIMSSIREKERFQQLPCLKVLRSIVKDNYSPPLSVKTVSLLFQIYQHYIFCGKTDYEWCVSSLLRGRNLNQEEVEWLIDNWDKSEHLVNRLLRYPSYSFQISEWARQRYLNSELLERKSEVMACFIKDEFLELCKKESVESIVWAIYYANLAIQQKEQMLDYIAKLYDEPELIKVCLRLELAKPLKTILKSHHAQQV